MYRIIYDMGHTIDGINFDGTLGDAKDRALDILANWACEVVAEGQDPSEELSESMVWIEELNFAGEWEEIWYPSEDELRSVCFPIFD